MRGGVDDRVRLLHGPYRAPCLHVGDRATCLRRDCDVKITGWTDALLPWPKGVPVGGRSGPSIVLDEELARAVRLESAAASITVHIPSLPVPVQLPVPPAVPAPSAGQVIDSGPCSGQSPAA